MIVSQIKDIIVESGSHAVMGQVLTLVQLEVSLRGIVFALTAWF